MQCTGWRIKCRISHLLLGLLLTTQTPLPAQTTVTPTAVQQAQGFQWLSLDAQNRNSACAVMDVNGDGLPDIVCGNRWYQAPNWQSHHVRNVEVIRGRQDDYANLPLDVNGDGLLDLVSANYRSRSLYWIRQPQRSAGSDAEWERTVIETPGAMEIGRAHV